MGSSQVSFIIFITLSFFFFCFFFSAAHGEDACSKAPFVDLCNKTLTTATGKAKPDLKSVAGAAVASAVASGASTSRYIADRLNGAVNNPSLQQCFSDCSDSYLDAVELLEDSAAAVDSGDYGGAKAQVAVAAADVDTCRDGCKRVKGGDAAALLQKNELVGKLCANALAILNLLSSA